MTVTQSIVRYGRETVDRRVIAGSGLSLSHRQGQCLDDALNRNDGVELMMTT